VPTGAIIESGTVGGQRYVRFADGTQICQGSVNVTPVANTPTFAAITFGAAFSSAVAGDLAVSVGYASSVLGSAVIEAGFTNVTTTGCDLGVYRTNTSVTTLRYTATGRWF